jgi:hypothetical protein
MKNMDEIEQLNQKGFVLKKGFFNPNELDNLKDEGQKIFFNQIKKFGIASKYSSEENFNLNLFRLFAEYPDIFINCAQQIQNLISVYRIAVSDEIIRTLKGYGVSFPTMIVKPVVFFSHKKLSKKVENWKTPPHQDWGSIQSSLDTTIVWVPWVDVTKDIGPLEIIEGSHKLGNVTSGKQGDFKTFNDEEYKDSYQSVEMEKGDALFFSSFLLHKSGNNISSNPRWSMHLRYSNLDEPTNIQRGYPYNYSYGPIDREITPNFPDKNNLNHIYK